MTAATQTQEPAEPSATYESFWEFYRDTSPRMLARAALICFHQHKAEDAVADAYLKAFCHWDRIGGFSRREAEKWVDTTMRRILWKASKKEKRTLLEVPVPPQALVEDTAEARRVLEAVARLPQRQRIALVAHCLEGRSQEDVARELGVKRGAVAALVFQARRSLERWLGYTPPAQPGPRDRLVQAPSGVVLSTSPSWTDPLSSKLRNTETWLCAALEADGRAVGRVRDVLTAELTRLSRVDSW